MNSQAVNEEPFYLPLRKDCQNWTNRPIGELARIQLIGPEALERYIDRDVLLIAGERGSGKSLSLVRKSARFIQDESPANYETLTAYSPFRNELAPGSIRIGKEKIQIMASIQRWAAYWRLTLLAHFCVLALRRRKVVQAEHRVDVLTREFKVDASEAKRAIDEYPKANIGAYRAADFYCQILHEAVGRIESLGRAMTVLIAAGPSVDEALLWSAPLEVSLNGSLGDRVLTIFADGLDEALGTPRGTPIFSLVRDNESEVSPSQHAEHDTLISLGISEVDRPTFRSGAHQAWLGLQVGYALAAEAIRKLFAGRVMCYGVFRPEAAAFIRGDNTYLNRQKAEGVVFEEILYSRPHLREILRLNVEGAVKQRATKHGLEVQAQNLSKGMRELLGFDGVSHTTVPFYRESVEDLILRHSFWAPRQVVGLLAAVVGRVHGLSNREKVDTDELVQEVAEAVDMEARVVFKDHIAGVSPMWHSGLTKLTSHLRSNVFLAEDIEEFEKKHTDETFFTELYSRGLIGIPRLDRNKAKYIQEFRRPDGNTVVLPPQVKYVVLHPAFAAEVVSQLHSEEERSHFYVSSFVAGDGLPCPEYLSKPRIQMSYFQTSGWGAHLHCPLGSASEININHPTHGPRASEAKAALSVPEEGALTLLGLIIAAMIRTGRSEISSNELAKQVGIFAEWGIGPLTINGVPLLPWVTVNLCQENKATSHKKLNELLEPCKLAVKREALSTFVLCTVPSDGAAQQNWQALDAHCVKLRSHIKRMAFDENTMKATN